jgi:anti-sigma regulatory factor (Ser/Thr protein kinase)
MAPEKADGFIIAINEVMTNAVRHGGGNGELRLWSGHALLCEVDDHGPGFDAGPHLERTTRPTPSRTGGLGLWLARQTSDTLTVDSGPNGTTVSITGKLST